jgi:hypothetical protein
VDLARVVTTGSRVWDYDKVLAEYAASLAHNGICMAYSDSTTVDRLVVFTSIEIVFDFLFFLQPPFAPRVT